MTRNSAVMAALMAAQLGVVALLLVMPPAEAATKHRSKKSTSQSQSVPVPSKTIVQRVANPYTSLGMLPDFAGVWEMDDQSLGTTSVAALKPPIKTELLGKVASNAQGEPGHLCQRGGMPIVMGAPLPFELLMTPGQVTILFESDGQVRRIHTDGKAKPDAYYPQHMGYSQGRWEGDTLVVETTDVDDSISISPFGGLPHGPNMRVVERMYLIKPGVLHVTTTVNDPDTLSQPWTVDRTYLRDPAGMIFEYFCDQNNRESMDSNGVQHVDLTPPK